MSLDALLGSEWLFYLAVILILLFCYLRQRQRRRAEEKLDRLAENSDASGYDRIVATCPSCNAQVAGHALFCPYCGKSLKDEVQGKEIVLKRKRQEVDARHRVSVFLRLRFLGEKT